jgi:uncharacterized RDD family membrane protein YckC
MNQWQSLEQDPDIQVRNSTAWTWPEATPGQRAAAFVLDLLIVVAAFEFISVLTNRFIGLTLSTSIEGLISVIYYLAMQSKSGQTFGKKVLGIRVVSLDPDLVDMPVPFRNLLLRETVGRSIGTLLLLYGYLRVVIKADHRGLHDLIGSTRVISLSHAEPKPIKFRYILAGLAFFAVILAFGYTYTLLYTTYPLKEYAKSLEMKGYRVDGIHGSVVRGFGIDHIYFANEDLEVEVYGASIKYDWHNSNEESEFFVNAFTVDSARINLKRLPAAASASASGTADSKKDEGGPFGNQKPVGSASGKSRAVTVKVIDLNNVDLTLPGHAAYRIERLSAADVQAKSIDQSLFFGKLNIDSRLLSLDASELSMQRNKLRLLKPAVVQIQPGLFPEILKAAVDLHVQGEFENLKPTSLNVSAFSSRVKVTLQGDTADVNISQFTPLHYFKTDLPIWDLNINVSGDFKNQKMNQLAGSAGLRHFRFDLNAANFAYIRKGVTYTMTPRLAADWRAMLVGHDPGVVLASSDHLFSRDILTEIYYARPYKQLSQGERDIIERDSRFFTDSLDAGLKKPAPVKIFVAKLVSRPSGRAPGSVKSSGRLSNRIPTKLPPFKKRSRRQERTNTD